MMYREDGYIKGHAVLKRTRTERTELRTGGHDLRWKQFGGWCRDNTLWSKWDFCFPDVVLLSCSDRPA